MTARADTQEADVRHDRRRYPRFTIPTRVALRGADGQWHWHQLEDASAVGVKVANGPSVAIGAQIPVHVERVGGGIARVVRLPSSHGACLDFEHADVPADLRHRRVAWLASDSPDYRRHQRVRPAPPAGRSIVVPIELSDGTQLEARLEDLSAGGLRLSAFADGAPALDTGMRIVAGGVPAALVWCAHGTMAVAFDRDVDVKQLKLKARPVSG
jgi:hypothetical protein